MVGMAGTIGRDGFGLARLWRWIRPRPGNARIYSLVLLLAAAILTAAAVATFVANTILDPNVEIVGGTISPDGKWVALTERVLPGPAMGIGDSAIELRHHDGLLMGPTLNRTFLIKYHSSKVTVTRVMTWVSRTARIFL